MKITVIAEDTASCAGVVAEHGLSLYIETGKHTLIADTGASSTTLDNAHALGADLSKVDTVFISHGHYDHAGGLLSFAKINKNAKIYIHEKAFGDFYHGEKYIGVDKNIAALPEVVKVGGDISPDGEIFIFSGLSGKREPPEGNRLLSERLDGKEYPDEFLHEMCLVISENGRKILISGCAHNGILNILDRYSALFGDVPDYVISGFHTVKKDGYTDKDTDNICNTAREMALMKTVFYTGHCTGETPFEIMKGIMGDKLCAIHCGDVFEL